MAGAPGRWHCPHRLTDVLLAWEGEQHAVFFDPRSGDTHLIAALGAWLAEWLQSGPLTDAALAQRLLDELDGDLPDGLSAPELLAQHLPRLADIGLLEEGPA